jgi:hypothetical protein
MRTRVAVITVLVALVSVASFPDAALAKGPTEATIEGAGLATPITLSGDEGDSSGMGALVELSGVVPAMFGQTPNPMLPAQPQEPLGPALVVTWRVPSGASTNSTVRQVVYPYAANGPLTYMEPGQPFFGSEHTHGGWFRAKPSLTSVLSDIGVPDRAALERGASASSPASSPASSSAPVRPALAVAAVVGLLLAVGLLAGARRRTRVAPA